MANLMEITALGLNWEPYQYMGNYSGQYQKIWNKAEIRAFLAKNGQNKAKSGLKPIY